VHLATVSRTVRDKYAATPKGTVELRRFFVGGVSGEDGVQISRDSVLDRIRAIIGDEDPSSPLSDEKIVDMLKAEGFALARRTLAKYRAKLGIGGVNERKGRTMAEIP
jgi:RNA polymerase sigma-54 factor